MFDIQRLQECYALLSENHIENGIKSDCKACPVACVLSEIAEPFGAEISVEVDGDVAELYDAQGCFIGRLHCTMALSEWIVKFDKSKGVSTGVVYINHDETQDDGLLWLGIDYNVKNYNLN